VDTGAADPVALDEEDLLAQVVRADGGGVAGGPCSKDT
jgi:hypothetical protein